MGQSGAKQANGQSTPPFGGLYATTRHNPSSPTQQFHNAVAVRTNTRSDSTPVNTDAPACVGLRNFGNTCYCNSVLQVLYCYEPFRKQCLKHLNDGDTVLSALSDLFNSMEQSRLSRNYSTSLSPKRFIQKLRQVNESFNDDQQHHDAHELFNFLVNNIAEHLMTRNSSENLPDSSLGNARAIKSSTDVSHANEVLRNKQSSNLTRSVAQRYPFFLSGYGKVPNSIAQKTWIHDIFQGSLVHRTTCLCCENTSERHEPFLDLAVEVGASGHTLEACIRNFSSVERLVGLDKYFCDTCACLQEAERRSRIGQLPPVLALHLKRFKYDESQGIYARIPHRVEFPLRLSLPADKPQRSYELFAVIVHIGVALSHGHYICCVESSRNKWFQFDDHIVSVRTDVWNQPGNSRCGVLQKISPESLRRFYGASKDRLEDGVQCGYLLFYSAVDDSTIL